jgi:hypothetical protein
MPTIKIDSVKKLLGLSTRIYGQLAYLSAILN